MDCQITGVITRICDVQTTGKGVAVKQIFFKKKKDGDYIYPSVLGKNVRLLDGFKPGDEVELEVELRGSAEKFTNCIIVGINKQKSNNGQKIH